MIGFACPECRWTLEVAEDQGGSTVRCPCCGRSVGVPTLVPAGAAARISGTPGARRGNNLLRKARALGARLPPLRRCGSPAALLVPLVLFPLPWLEVRCDRPVGDGGTRTLAEQSGLQAAYGSYSETPLSASARSERDRIEARVRALPNRPTVSASPLMVLYPLVLLGGSLFGLLARRDGLRSAALVGCGLAAGALLLLQAFRGFPLEQAVRTVGAEGRLAGVDFRITLGTSGLLEVRYTAWLWLSAVALGGALAVACAEWWFASGPGRRTFLWAGWVRGAQK